MQIDSIHYIPFNVRLRLDMSSTWLQIAFKYTIIYNIAPQYSIMMKRLNEQVFDNRFEVLDDSRIVNLKTPIANEATKDLQW